MRRREFLAASCVGGLAPLGAAGAAGSKPNKQLYELRLYRVKSAGKAKVLDAFLRDAAIPALNRLGIGPVGVFKLMPEANKPKPVPMGVHDAYVLLPHATGESLATAAARLMRDAKFMKAGAAVHDAPMKDPVYKRIEISLLLAFDDAPKVETPVKKDSRIFQLRIYESHNRRAARKKVEMFNAGGEIALFRRCGMQPVFFGEALAGARVPNLTYMLVFGDMDASKAAWRKFLRHADWQKMKSDPAYKDTVSNITNIFLRPAAYSQI